MEELDLKELFNIFWSKKVYIVLIIIIFMILGIIYSMFLITPKYKSSTTLVLAKTDNIGNTTVTDSITQTDITLNQKLISTYSELIKSKAVIRQVITNLNNPYIQEDNLRGNITVDSIKNTELIQISVINENPEYARSIASETAKVFTEKVAEIYNINNVYMVDEAEVAIAPYNVKHVKNTLLFMMVGIVLAFLYAILANMLDTTIKTAEDVEKSTGLLVLAQIPEYNTEIMKTGGKKKQ